MMNSGRKKKAGANVRFQHHDGRRIALGLTVDLVPQSSRLFLLNQLCTLFQKFLDLW